MILKLLPEVVSLEPLGVVLGELLGLGLLELLGLFRLESLARAGGSDERGSGHCSYCARCCQGTSKTHVSS